MPPVPRATIERQLEAAYNALETLGRERTKLQDTIAGLSDNSDATAALTAKDAAIATLTAENEALRDELSQYRKALGDLLAKIGAELSQPS
jgi:cell division protein FtsB